MRAADWPRSAPQGDGWHACPAGAYFCSCKSRQNTLGAVPQDPLTLKLRLDTNWTFQQMLKSRFVRRRRYALKVPAAHFYVEIVDRVPLPRHGGGVGGAEPSAASGGCSEAEHPQRSKKSSEQASSAKIFSGTARRWGQMRLRLPLERICVQYGFGFFSPEKSKFVASTAKRQKGVCQGGICPP